MITMTCNFDQTIPAIGNEKGKHTLTHMFLNKITHNRKDRIAFEQVYIGRKAHNGNVDRI